MPLSIERHDEILTSLNNPELSHTDRSELLTELRTGFSETTQTLNDTTSTLEKAQKEKDDLLVANSHYFRQLQSQNPIGQTDDPLDKPNIVPVSDLFK